MSTNNLINQLNYKTANSGENILVRKILAPTEMGTDGTRSLVTNALPVDQIRLDANDEQVIINFPIPIDMDPDVSTMVVRVGLTFALTTGSASPSVSVDLSGLTAIREGASNLSELASAIPLPTTTPGVSDAVGKLVTVEFDLTSALTGLTDKLTVGDVLGIAMSATIAGTAPSASVYAGYVEYGSMIVAASGSNRI